MKVVIVNTAANKGGAAVAANRLMQSLCAAGVECTMLVRESNQAQKNVQIFSSNYFLLKWNQALFFLELLLLQILKRNGKEFSLAAFGPHLADHPLIKNADVINLHWAQNAYLSLSELQAIQNLGKPIAWTLHDMWAITGGCHYNEHCRKFESECDHCPMLKNDSLSNISLHQFKAKQKTYSDRIHFICPSNWLAAETSKSALTKNNPVTVIPNTLDLSEFKPMDREQAKNYFGIQTDKKIILFVSMSLSDQRKGFEWFENAILGLEKSDTDWKNKYEILAIGRAAAKPKFETTIHYTGRLNGSKAMANAYAAADVFVTPSQQDNLPNTVVESLACGTPVVAFQIGGMPDLIQHLHNGYLAKFQDLADLQNGIVHCLTNDLSNNTREGILTLVDSKKVAAQYIAVFENLCK